MTLRPLVVLAILALLLATGCATVTFKRGAGPGGAKADEDACRATSETQAAYVACLRERGWMVAGKGAEASPTKAPAPAATAAPAKPSTPAQPAPAAAPAKSTETTPPAVAKEPAKATRPPRAGEPSPDEPAVEAPPLDPNAIVTVQSWWKLGGTAADLDRAVAACVGELGAAHKPNAAVTEVTVALKDCLRTKKWFPVGGTGSVY